MTSLHLLVNHLLYTDIADDLQTLHDLALYESGDALLGEHEKDALNNVIHLKKRLENLTDADRALLSSLAH